MSFNNVDALAEAYDAVFALFDRLRECAAVDRRDGHRGCFGGDYKDSSVVGIRSQRCARVAVDRGSCRINYVVNAVYGVVAAVLELKVVCLRAAGVAEDDVGRHVGSVDGACECPFPNQVAVCSLAHHSGALSRPFCACAAGEVGVCSAAPAPNAYFLV